EAAAWQREPAAVSRRYGLIGALLALRPPKLAGISAPKLGTAVLATTVAGFLGFLAVGLVVMDQRSSRSSNDLEAVAPQLAPTSLATLTPPSAPTTAPEPGIVSRSVQAATPSGLVPPPEVQQASFTPEPSPTLSPDVLTELPAGAAEAIESYAATQ